METAEYGAAVQNYNRWKSAYDNEQNRINLENQRIRSRNSAALAEANKKADNWEVEIQKRINNDPSWHAMFTRVTNGGSLYDYSSPWQFTGRKVVVNIQSFGQTIVCNSFPYTQEAELKNYIGKYNPNIKY
jgi:hypothetical protein